MHPSTVAVRPPSTRRRLRRRRRCRTAERGVSDVVATILILSLTVVLASTVFLFVTTYPQVPVPQENAFALNFTLGQVCLSKCGGGSPVYGAGMQSLAITLVGGPSISGSSPSQSAVRLASQQKPYSFPTPFTLASGLPNGATTWSFGQVWTINLTSYHLPAFDNLTVAVTALGKVVLDTVAPGTPPNELPYFTSFGVTPAHPLTNQSFTVYCTVVIPMGPKAPNPVQIDLNQVPGPGHSTTLKSMTNASSTPTFWTYTVPATGSSASFYLYVIATDRLGQKSTLVIPLKVG
jgi:hypothetical protein